MIDGTTESARQRLHAPSHGTEGMTSNATREPTGGGVMAAKLVKTKTPGVFKRGDRYAVIYRDANGRQRQESTHLRSGEEAALHASRRRRGWLLPDTDPGALRRLCPLMDRALSGQRPARVHRRHPRRVPPGPGALRHPVSRALASRADHPAPRRRVRSVVVRSRRARPRAGGRLGQAHSRSGALLPALRDGRGPDPPQSDAGCRATRPRRAQADRGRHRRHGRSSGRASAHHRPARRVPARIPPTPSTAVRRCWPRPG